MKKLTKTTENELSNKYYEGLNFFLSKERRVPIKRGCPNKECFCTGRCNEVIGYRDKIPGEK